MYSVPGTYVGNTGGALVPCRYYSGTSGTRCLFSFQPVIPVSLVSIGGHITSKLNELNAVLDASRGGWCRLIGASTAALAAEIHAISVAFDGPTSMHTQTNTPIHKHIRGKRAIKMNKPTLSANVLGVFFRHMRTSDR